MRKIDKLLQEYAESHQNKTNKLIHWICVPLIFFSIVGLIWSIPNSLIINFLGEGSRVFLNWAAIALLLVLIYYLSLSFPIFIGMMIFSLICLFVVDFISQVNILPVWAISLIIFVLAWIGQFYGHEVEGKKPSFFKDLQFLLIGPAWVIHYFYKKLGIPY